MASSGYYSTAQVYQAGSYGSGAFLIALILFLVLIGILIFIYMVLVKPAGTLAVTYEYRNLGQPLPGQTATPAGMQQPGSNVAPGEPWR